MTVISSSTNIPYANNRQSPVAAWPQVVTVALIFGFTGWLLARGFDPLTALLITTGGVVVSTGLTMLPRSLAKLVRAMGQQV